MILLLPLVAIAFGVFFFVYGGYDDSPGAQGLGALIALGGLASAFRRWRRKP